MWENVFRFSAEVATILTRLTTKSGYLPQGAKTSSYLANLVFYRDEPELVRHLASVGWRYSRLTDDITISSLKRVLDTEVSDMTRTVIGFITRNHYALKRSKLHIYRNNVPMEVNNLIVNAHPALPKEERKKIRAQNHQVQKALVDGKAVDSSMLNSTKGKLAKLKRFHSRNFESILGVPGLKNS